MIHPIAISIIFLATLFVVCVAAARIRFSCPSWLRWTLDGLFLLMLVVLPSDELFFILLFYAAALYGFSKVDRTVLDAARMQGMGVCGTFWRVFFPAARGVFGLVLLLVIVRMTVGFALFSFDVSIADLFDCLQ